MHVQVVPFEIHRLILYLYVALHQLCVEVGRAGEKKRLNDSKHHSFDEGDHKLVLLCGLVQHSADLYSIRVQLDDHTVSVLSGQRLAYRYWKRPGLTNSMFSVFFLAKAMRFGKKNAHAQMRFVCGCSRNKGRSDLTDTGRDSDGETAGFL